ncbi:MAG: chromosome partitioning protein ParB, partial [Oscillospiraceae bacterium]
DLNFFEQAYAINKLVKEYGISQKDIAIKLGKQQSTIANKLRLLKLSLKVKQLIIEHSLTERHARALLKMEEDEQRLACLSYVIKHKLNVEQTENYIQNLLFKDQPKSAKKILVVKDVRVFMNTVNKAVQIMKYAGLSIDTDKTEDENYINYIVKIPKVQAYQQVNCH